MFWTGLIVGIFLGANLGIVIAGLLFAAKRRNAENHSSQTPMDQAVIDKDEEVQGDLLPPLAKPVTYLDRFPHS